MKEAYLSIILLAAGAGWWMHQSDTASDLGQCLHHAESVLELKTLNLSDKKSVFGVSPKQNYAECITNSNFKPSFCKGLYLNANGWVRDCMAERGYWFEDADLHLYCGHSPYNNGTFNPWQGGAERPSICDWQQYEKPECYHRRVEFVLTHPWTWSGESADHAKAMKAWHDAQ
jgi:hypothetical protein